MDWQAAELVDLVQASLKSEQIEWAMNIEICDKLLANPGLTTKVMPLLTSALRASRTDADIEKEQENQQNFGFRNGQSSVRNSGTAARQFSGGSGTTGFRSDHPVTTGSRLGHPVYGRNHAGSTGRLNSRNNASAKLEKNQRPNQSDGISLKKTLTALANVGNASHLVRVSVCLSLLEMLIKNCGITFVRYIDEEFCRIYERLIRKKQSVSYSVSRNIFKGVNALQGMFKSSSSSTSSIACSRGENAVGGQGEAGGGLGAMLVDTDTSLVWDQIIKKAMTLLQMIASSLVMHQEENPLIFDLYRNLRSDRTLTFPKIGKGGIGVRGGVEEEYLMPSTAIEGAPPTVKHSHSGPETANGSLAAAATDTALKTNEPPVINTDLLDLDKDAIIGGALGAILGGKQSSTSALQCMQTTETAKSIDEGFCVMPLVSDQQPGSPLAADEIEILRKNLETLEQYLEMMPSIGENAKNGIRIPDTDAAHNCRMMQPRLGALIQQHAEDETPGDEDINQQLMIGMMNLLSRIDTILEAHFIPRPPSPSSNNNGNAPTGKTSKMTIGGSSSSFSGSKPQSSPIAAPPTSDPHALSPAEQEAADRITAMLLQERELYEARNDPNARISHREATLIPPELQHIVFGSSRRSKLVARNMEEVASFRQRRPNSRHLYEESTQNRESIRTGYPPNVRPARQDDRVFQVNLMFKCERCREGYLDNTKTFCSNCGRVQKRAPPPRQIDTTIKRSKKNQLSAAKLLINDSKNIGGDSIEGANANNSNTTILKTQSGNGTVTTSAFGSDGTGFGASSISKPISEIGAGTSGKSFHPSKGMGLVWDRLRQLNQKSVREDSETLLKKPNMLGDSNQNEILTSQKRGLLDGDRDGDDSPIDGGGDHPDDDARNWRFVEDDASTTRPYWYNKKTAKSQWQPPGWIMDLFARKQGYQEGECRSPGGNTDHSDITSPNHALRARMLSDD